MYMKITSGIPWPPFNLSEHINWPAHLNMHCAHPYIYTYMCSPLETHTNRCIYRYTRTSHRTRFSLPGTTMFTTTGYFWCYPDLPVLFSSHPSPLNPSSLSLWSFVFIHLHLLSPCISYRLLWAPLSLGKLFCLFYLPPSLSSIPLFCLPLPISSHHGTLRASQSDAQ